MKRAVDVLFGGDDGSGCSYRAKSLKMPESAPAAFKECKHLPQSQLAAVVLMSHAQVSTKLDQVNMKLDQVLALMGDPAAVARAAGASTSVLPLQQQQQPKLDISILKREIVSILGRQAFEPPLFFLGSEQPARAAATTFILEQLTPGAKERSAFYSPAGTAVDGRANKAVVDLKTLVADVLKGYKATLSATGRKLVAASQKEGEQAMFSPKVRCERRIHFR